MMYVTLDIILEIAISYWSRECHSGIHC
jgi:hypothetical protein